MGPTGSRNFANLSDFNFQVLCEFQKNIWRGSRGFLGAPKVGFWDVSEKF